MKTVTIKYLELLKKKFQLENQNQVAKFLDVRPSRIGNYYQEKRQLDMYMTFKVADLLEVNPDDIIIEMSQEKAKNPKEREFWLKKASLLSASIALVLTALLAIPEQTMADQYIVYYVKLNLYLE